MFRFPRTRNLVLPLIAGIVLIGVGAAAALNTPGPTVPTAVGPLSQPTATPHLPPADIDADVPKRLSTATFGMG